MNELMESISLYLQTTAQIGTPILLATLGGILSEKVGNMNLGVEGMMLLGAVTGFMAALATASPLLAVLAAAVAGGLGALIYAVITVTFRGNQVVTGLALTIFGGGVSSFMGKNLTGLALPDQVLAGFAAYKVPFLGDIPLLGKMLFQQSIYVQMALVCAVVLYLYLNKTNPGLSMRAVGENPGAADASGLNVSRIKYLHIVAGGCLCGVGGAYLSLVFVPRWQDNITAGMGWIAVALVIFSTWNPLKAIFGAYLFGALRGMSLKMQNVDLSLMGMEIKLIPQLLDMIPYIATILVLVFITLNKKQENLPPKGLGTPYFREER